MKKVSIILNIVLLLTTLFFVVYAQIQTDLAIEREAEANVLREYQNALVLKANQAAADAEKSAAESILAQREAEEAMRLLVECQGK